jgi:hypothetical protein
MPGSGIDINEIGGQVRTPDELRLRLRAGHPADIHELLRDLTVTMYDEDVGAIDSATAYGDLAAVPGDWPEGEAVPTRVNEALDVLAARTPLGVVGSAAFTPSTAEDWPVQPTTIADALDKLAARLNVLEP